jgi:hypothetical protein
VFSFETEAIMKDVTLIGIDLGKHSMAKTATARHCCAKSSAASS